MLALKHKNALSRLFETMIHKTKKTESYVDLLQTCWVAVHMKTVTPITTAPGGECSYEFWFIVPYSCKVRSPYLTNTHRDGQMTHSAAH